jgi:hypothetical protein
VHPRIFAVSIGVNSVIGDCMYFLKIHRAAPVAEVWEAYATQKNVA